MPAFLTPRRYRGVEFLDEPGVDPGIARRSLRDVARANQLFGGTRTALVELDHALRASAGRPMTLLDVGTGAADIPVRARALARRRGVELRTLGVDSSETLARAAKSPQLPTIRADALRLPLRDRSVDIALCSQLLHHFERARCIMLLRELDRVARQLVIVSDLRRSWVAAGGLWLASWALGFHPVSRHDGVVSVLRGFTPAELAELVRDATGRSPRVRERLGYRLSASWEPEGGC